MPSFYIKQKIFSLVDNYVVYDQQGNEVFKVAGRFFSIPKKLDIFSQATNQVIYTLQWKLLRLLPTFLLLDGYGNQVAVIRKRFSLLRPVIDIESSFGSFTLEGEIFAHQFQLIQNGFVKASIAKKWFSLGDAYELDIQANENVEFYVALLISIDQAIHEQKNAHHS